MTLPDPSLPKDPDYSVENPTHRMVHLTTTYIISGSIGRECLFEFLEFHCIYAHRKGKCPHTQERRSCDQLGQGTPWRSMAVEDLMQGTDGVDLGGDH